MNISIIIPIHNLGYASNYCLKGCLDSIISQNYSDFEVLLIENGSTDDTALVAEDYVRKDDRFKLISLAGAGISAARNEELKNMGGGI